VQQKLQQPLVRVVETQQQLRADLAAKKNHRQKNSSGKREKKQYWHLLQFSSNIALTHTTKSSMACVADERLCGWKRRIAEAQAGPFFGEKRVVCVAEITNESASASARMNLG
jgi:hypothetical protein